MSDNSYFPFIKNSILKNNLDNCFGYILEIIPLVESKKYDSIIKSSFRKSIIVNTGSIVEALLFYVMDTSFSDRDIQEFYATWKLKNKKILYSHENEEKKIVAGDFVKKLSKTKKEKMNLSQICSFLKSKDIIGESIVSEVDTLGKLRNGLHLSTYKSVRSYTDKDLEKSFHVARTIKNFVRNYNN